MGQAHKEPAPSMFFCFFMTCFDSEKPNGRFQPLGFQIIHKTAAA